MVYSVVVCAGAPVWVCVCVCVCVCVRGVVGDEGGECLE